MFSADEAQDIDHHLNWFNTHDGYIPFTFVVNDIQPAPDNLAGATLSVPRPWTPPGPIVLADQDGHWLITHDTAMVLLKALWANAHGGGGGGVAGSPLGPSIFGPVFSPSI